MKFDCSPLIRTALAGAVLLVLVTALSACNKPAASAAAPAKLPLLIQPQDLLSLAADSQLSGVAINGSIQPQRRADLRAEVSATVLQVLHENGDVVRRGALLVRLDDTAIRENLASAQEALRAARQSFEQAQRQYQRLQTLQASGMVTTQQFEDAEIRRNNAQSDLSAAKTRAVQAQQQLERTLARAPFDGIVSERKVSAGDSVQIGRELLKVMDATSLRFEGLLAAEALAAVRIGQAVTFRVNGYGAQEFAGRVTRISPAANASTRQLEVLVDFAGTSKPQLAGLYAEGFLAASAQAALLLPEQVLAREGDKVFAWRLQGDRLQKVALVLGPRDPRRGDYVLRSGLAVGDQLVRNPTAGLQDGQKVQLEKAAQSAVGAGK